MGLGLFKTETYRRGIAVSSLLNIINQGLGFLTSILFAYYFGTQAKTDVYYYCLSVISLLAGFLGAVNSFVLIPESMRLAEKVGREASMRFLNFFLYLWTALAGLMTLWICFDPPLFFTRISRFPVGLLQEHAPIVYWCIPMLGLQVVGGLLTDTLFSQKFFTLPMVLNLGNRIAVLASLVLLESWLDIQSILVAAVVMNVVQVALCAALMTSRLQWRWKIPALQVERRVVGDALFTLFGVSASTASAYAPVYLMSGFAAGILTAMNFAQRLAMMPAQVITNQISAVVGIKLNETLARDDAAEANRAYRRTNDLLIGILVPASVFLSVYAREVIVVSFRRGSFDETSVQNAALFFRYLILGVPFTAINTIVARVMIAKQKIRTSFWYQVATNLALTAMLFAAVARLGPVGYPAAQLVFDGANVFALILFLRWVTPFLDYQSVLRSLVFAYGAHIITFVGLLGIRKLATPFGDLLSLTAGAFAAGVLFLVTAPLHPGGRECLAVLKFTLERISGRTLQS